MKYDKELLEDIIVDLQSIQEFDYITFPKEDDEKVKNILISIRKEVDDIQEMMDNNYSY